MKKRYKRVLLKKLVSRLNNISLNKKFLLIYIICILIPIISLNLMLYINLSQNMLKEQQARDISAMERICANITKRIDECIGVTYAIRMDNKINSTLENRYDTKRVYLEMYSKYLDQSLSKYLGIFTQINDIRIYTNNDTIVSGGNYFIIDDGIRRTGWYGKLKKSDKSVLIHPAAHEKRILLVKWLRNSIPENPISKFIYMEIDLSFIDSVIESEYLNAAYALKSEGTVIASNGVFKDSQKQYVISHNFSNKAYLSGWNIYILPQNQSRSFFNRALLLVIILALISMIFVTPIIYAVTLSVSSRIKLIADQMKNLGRQKFDIIKGYDSKDEVGILINEFNFMSRKISQLINEVLMAEIQKKNLEIERKQAELNALQSQIEPHYLYNTLNTIRMKCVLKDETDTARIIRHVANMFRRIIRWDNDIITVSEEIEMIKEFLEVQKYRFGDKLNYSINVCEEAANCSIPKMVLQPFVENASIHGVESITYKGNINISVKLENRKIICKIKDNGIGMKEDVRKMVLKSINEDSSEFNNIGIRNVIRRVKFYYDEDYKFSLGSDEKKGTVVILELPNEIKPVLYG